jgi:hypothetical protein
MDLDLAVLDAFEIRTEFKRELLDRATKITWLVLNELSHLDRLFHPWYELGGRPDAGWDWKDAQPISVPALVANPRLATPHRRKSITKTAKSLRLFRDYGDRAPVPIQFTILTYTLAEGGRLVLDSSHRLAAAAMLVNDGWPFRILELSICGPVDGEICPDLYHHADGVPSHLLKLPAPESK